MDGRAQTADEQGIPAMSRSLCSSEHTTAILLWNGSRGYTLTTLRIADGKLFAFVKLKCVKHETSINISQNGRTCLG